MKGDLQCESFQTLHQNIQNNIMSQKTSQRSAKINIYICTYYSMADKGKCHQQLSIFSQISPLVTNDFWILTWSPRHNFHYFLLQNIYKIWKKYIFVKPCFKKNLVVSFFKYPNSTQGNMRSKIRIVGLRHLQNAAL